MQPPRGDAASDLALAAAKEAARATVEDLFGKLGVNVADFKSLQSFRDDLAFIHRLRSGSAKVGARFLLTIVSVLAGAMVIGLWEVAKAWLSAALHHH